MYHQVLNPSEREAAGRKTNPAYILSQDRFREQLECIAANGYSPLTLDEVLNGADELGKGVVITFDDGWLDNYTNVLPLLRQFGFKATVFVVSDFIGQPGYLTWDQLREMQLSGIAIHSHTASHRPLAELDESEITHELLSSKKSLEEGLKTAVNFISMPQGSFNQKVLNIARQVGYRAVCTSVPGFSHTRSPLPLFKRINVAEEYDSQMFSRIIQQDRMWLMPVIFAKKIKSGIRRIIGYDTYRRLYRLRYMIKG